MTITNEKYIHIINYQNLYPSVTLLFDLIINNYHNNHI